MYSIQQRREIAARIANPEYIPAYRRLLKLSGSPYASLIDTNEKKWAILLVSALLEDYTEEEIIRSIKSPSEAPKTAPAVISAPAATVAVKKNVQKSRNTRASTGMTWTTLWSGLRTLSTRMRSIWAALSGKWKAACMTRRCRRNS